MDARAALVSWPLFVLALFASCPIRVQAQSISSDTAVPPLQWINLTGLLAGSGGPPPLKDASIGYEDSTRTLLIFGGESQTGIPQSQTYLLNLDSLEWSTPSPPSNLGGSPPARSAAIGGGDFAASYRNAHIVIGGMGTSGPLNDVWAFDYTSQFWASVSTSGAPSRAQAVGGIDIRVPFNTTGSATPVNTFYLAGGVDSSGPVALSNTWQFQVTGTLSSNNPTSLTGTWSEQSIGSFPALSGAGGTVLAQQAIAIGGCTGTSNATISCATQDSFAINIATAVTTSGATCVAPRVGAAIAANENEFSSNFGTQAFILSGLYDTTQWSDDGGSTKGEVDVWEVGTGSWSRVLPSGDPGSSGTATFPSAREGATAFSFNSGLVGSSRSSYSDIIMFGGRDASGNYLSEMWLLRLYNGSISQSNATWSGFGAGSLQTGVDASGEGVTVQLLSDCVSAIGSSTSATSAPAQTISSSPTQTSTSPSSIPGNVVFDTNILHKLLSPLSVVILLPAVIFHRASLPSTAASQPPAKFLTLRYLAALTGVAAYGLGIAGLATSFTSVSRVQSTTTKRFFSATGNVLQTAHGQAGLALSVAFYGLLPILFFLYFGWRRLFGTPTVAVEEIRDSPQRSRANSVDAPEKPNPSSAQNTVGNGRPASSSEPRPQRRRMHSWGGRGLTLLPGPRSHEGRVSEDSTMSPDSAETSTGYRGFEVVNRPARVRRLSTNAVHELSFPRSPLTPRSLGDLSSVSWLDRRRSLHAAGELDYVLSQMNRTAPPTPGTAEVMSTSTGALMVDTSLEPARPRATMPTMAEVALSSLFHALVLALSILSLQVMWMKAPKVIFVVFLVWLAVFYTVLVTLSWYGRPRSSALTALLSRLHGRSRYIPTPSPVNPLTPSPAASRPLSTVGTDHFPFPSNSPYLHQPTVRTAHEDELSASHGGHYDIDEADSDDDEPTRQRRIEEEMERRDVSIVTVPKRRLWVVNPS